MERLTDCAQGYCEMYCKKYEHCFGDPGDCIFKDEIKLYDAVKSIEGIVPFERLLELACADKAGRLVVLPCKVGDTVYILHRTFDGADVVGETELWWTDIPQLGKTVFLTREEAEKALEAMKDE